MRESAVEGQRREPATGDARNATRRAGWRPFAAADVFDSSHEYPERHPMLKTANEACQKSVFDRMAGWTGWFWASSSYVVILSSCYPV